MKIIKQGIYQQHCTTCDSTIEYTITDTIEHQQYLEQLKKDPKTKFNTPYRTINCPVCNQTITTDTTPPPSPYQRDND
jgi:hypothetical protein